MWKSDNMGLSTRFRHISLLSRFIVVVQNCDYSETKIDSFYPLIKFQSLGISITFEGLIHSISSGTKIALFYPLYGKNSIWLKGGRK
jgi:hypothetical protein